MTEPEAVQHREDSADLPSTTPRELEGFKALGFFTADHAVIENGKVYANGAYWSTLSFPAFPALLPAASLVAVLQVPWHAHNQDHDFTIEFMDSDARPVPGFNLQGQFRGSPAPHMRYGEPGVLPVAVPIFGLQFPRSGDYSFVLKVDGHEIARYSIHVIQVAMAGGFAVPAMKPPPSPTDW